MSLRDLLWLAVIALLGYASWQFVRALRAPREPGAAGVQAPARGPTGPAGPRESEEAGANATIADDEDGLDEGDFEYAPVLASRPVVAPAPAEPAAGGYGSSGAGSAEQPGGGAEAEVFALQLENSRLRQEFQAQRDLVALQQQEITRLVEDVTALQDELDRIRVQPASSPEYSEALLLSSQGLNAEMIAARCGITLAEAELVLSLSRRGEGGT